MSNYNTPYDDSFRTLLTDCSRLVIPVVNEIFNESHDITEAIRLFQNEVFITSGNDQKRITDSNFELGSDSKRYHIECQSNSDGTIIVRIFEYATQIAINTAQIDVSKTIFNLPQSGVLYLRKNESLPDEHIVIIKAPNGSELQYSVPALKVIDYSMDSLLDKKLYMLIPFYFFSYKLKEMEIKSENNDNSLITEMEHFYSQLWTRLDALVEADELTAMEMGAIKAMCEKVALALSENYKNVKKD